MKLSKAQQINFMNKVKRIGRLVFSLAPLYQLVFFWVTLEFSLEILSPSLIQMLDTFLLLTLKLAASSALSMAGLVSVLALIAPKALPLIWAAFSKTFSFISPMVKWLIPKMLRVHQILTLSYIKPVSDRFFSGFLYSCALISLWVTYPALTQVPLSLMWIYIAVVGAARIMANRIDREIPYFLHYLLLRAFIIARAPMKKGSAYFQACNEAYLYAVKNFFIDRVKVLLAAGVEVNQTDLLAPTKTALSYAIDNCDIQMVKLLISAGADLTTESLKGNFREMLTRVIHGYNRVGAVELLNLLSEKQIEVMLENSALFKNPIVAEYRLKISLFESVWVMVKTMRQTDPSFSEPAVIRSQILPMLKPEWCSEKEYKNLSEEVFKKTLMALDRLDNKKRKSTDTFLAPLAAGPVVFRRDEKPQAAEVENEVIIEVLAKKAPT
jgi:hypothetical protein